MTIFELRDFQGSRRNLSRELKGHTISDDQHSLVTEGLGYLDPDEGGFVCTIAPSGIYDMMRRFESLSLFNYATNSPNVDHLLSLSRLNIQRAIIENTQLLGMTMQWLAPDDAISIFNIVQPHSHISESEGTIPPSLKPTACQRQILHHPWLDFFPFPNLRDNLIIVQDEIDEDDLCHDLMAFWDTHNTGATLLVWGPAWDPKNWEVTPAFLKKWGNLLRGCGELLESTNKWRIQRGEKPIFWGKIEKHSDTFLVR